MYNFNGLDEIIIANKALHRTPHTVALFAKTRKKSRQHATPVNAALYF